MKLEILRFNSSDDFTSGILFDVSNNKRKFLCYTLEDEHRDVKIKHETRIPAGTYKLSLQKAGRFHERYKSKFANKGADWWQGSILVNDVPNFTGILWHLGNLESQTSGCLLLGKDQKSDNWIGNSTLAFVEVYPLVRDAILSGDPVTATYIDYDGEILDNKSKDHVMNIPQVTKIQEDIMDILSTEIKSLKTEVKALRQTIILKGLHPK